MSSPALTPFPLTRSQQQYWHCLHVYLQKICVYIYTNTHIVHLTTLKELHGIWHVEFHNSKKTSKKAVPTPKKRDQRDEIFDSLALISGLVTFKRFPFLANGELCLQLVSFYHPSNSGCKSSPLGWQYIFKVGIFSPGWWFQAIWKNKIGSFPQGSGWKYKIFELPPPSISINKPSYHVSKDVYKKWALRYNQKTCGFTRWCSWTHSLSHGRLRAQG